MEIRRRVGSSHTYGDARVTTDIPERDLAYLAGASYAIPPNDFVPLNTVPPTLIAAFPRSACEKPNGVDAWLQCGGRGKIVRSMINDGPRIECEEWMCLPCSGA